ncbi:hypothetical protein [Tibeticola sp.]|uniref:hypothetical protein n=1 Tax=Tibeticola sp. TaxID=2005368 RepID=UPI0025DC2C17|nr:hypothetical protein [Tibeticola sp.]
MTDIKLHPTTDENFPPHIHRCVVRRQLDEHIVLEMTARTTAEPSRMMNHTPSADSRLLSESSPQQSQRPGPKTIGQDIENVNDIPYYQRHSPAQRVPTTISW